MYSFSKLFRRFVSMVSLSKLFPNSFFSDVAIFSISFSNEVWFILSPIPNYYVFCYFSFCEAFCKYSSVVFFHFLLYHLDILFLMYCHISLRIVFMITSAIVIVRFFRLFILQFGLSKKEKVRFLPASVCQVLPFVPFPFVCFSVITIMPIF